MRCTNLAAFFDSSFSSESAWGSRYKGKTIQLKACLPDGGTVAFQALIADTCNDDDCKGCCSENAQPFGKLVDIEINTMYRYFQQRGFPDTIYYKIV